jgi:Bacterial CdiA-CT RNAse A domain
MQIEKVWTLDDVKADWARVKCEVAYVRMLFAARDYRLAVERSQKFNPYHDDAGRFTTADGVGGGAGNDVLAGGDGNDPAAGGAGNDSFQVTQAESSANFQIDLADEASRGGHTHTDHVKKTPEMLAAHVRQEAARFAAEGTKATRIRAGSYPSLEAATKLTNATLAQNQDKVGRVARGEIRREFITGVFSSATGIEAYARNVSEQPRIRETTGVGVSIVYDARSKNGFTVISSYPRNDD